MSNAAKALPRDPKMQPFAGMDMRDLLRDRAEKRADHPFLIWAPFEGDDQQWSYGEFYAAINRLAAGLHDKGVQPGDFVLIHLDNCPEILFAWYACAMLGAVAVTTNARSSGDELNYFADNSNAVAAITQPKFAELVRDNCPRLKWVAVTETDNGAPAAFPEGFDRFADIDGDPATIPNWPTDPMRPVGVQYTSGTTSRPKGVVWTHANALWGGKTCATHMDMRPDDVHLVYLPLFHTNAQSYSILSTLWVGGTAVIQPRFSATRFWPVSLRYKCTWTSMIPFVAKALLAQPVPDDHHYRLWGNGICEAPWDPHFRVKTIGWWGMTETITHGTVGDAHLPNRPLSMGRPAPSYEIAVVDDDGKPVAVGETGNLWIKGVRGVSLFSEYLNNPEATENSFNEEGFFETGDRVTVFEDGFLGFADRDKDMLKVGGENVAASEIERVIMTVPGISEVAVVARKDKMLDEVPVAFVLPADHSEDDHMRATTLAEHCMEACEKQLADFKVPREIRIVAELPRSTLEKIAKAELRKIANNEHQD